MSDKPPGWYPNIANPGEELYGDGYKWNGQRQVPSDSTPLPPPNAASGWYPSGPGLESYWDGSGWIGSSRATLAKPSALPPTPSAPAKRKLGFGGCVTVLLAVLAIIVIVNVAAQSGRDTSTPAADSHAVSAPKAPKQPTAAELRDEAARAEGWQVIESGDLYIKANESGTFTCGYAPCLWYNVQSEIGCPGGVYVKADVMSNGGAVGWTNAISPSVRPGESVLVQLEDHQRLGDQFRLSEVICMP